MPQYRYAFDDQTSLVDVLQLPEQREELASSYTCIGCDQPLVAKTKGVHREKHFAHKVATPTCSNESYLHKLAKQVFLDEYRACLAENQPYLIDLTHPKTCSKYQTLLGHTCQLGTITKSYDLTNYYDHIALEQRDGSFIPDLLLSSSADSSQKLYVEIAVTHFLSQAKQASSDRIIEIPIENEDDIEKLRRRHLTEAEASFLNFNRWSAPVPDADCTCAFRPYYCFLIYESGKSILMEGTLTELAAQYRRRASTVQYARLREVSFDYDRGYTFIELVEEAHARGFPVRNCFLCRYAGDNWSLDATMPIFCKYLRKTCSSNEAATCKSYRYQARD